MQPCSFEMERRLVPLVVLTIFLLTETTTGSEQHLTQKRQSIRAQGCIAAGYTHCCAFGSCRVELPDGGQCHCDHYCVDNSYYSYSNYLHHNCCSDNPCEGISFEKYQYFVGEGDGFVEVCADLYGRQGLTVAVQFSTISVSAQVGRDFNGTSEVVQMTSGERKCWNITILDDSISEGQQANYLGQAMEYFYIHLRPIRSSIGSSYVRVYITDNDQDTLPYQVLLEGRNRYYYRYNYLTLSCDRNVDHVVVEGDDPLEFCVYILGSVGETVVANVVTWDGTATASQDYIASNQTLTFTTPERKCIRIEIVDDSEVERNEEFWVFLTIPTDTGSEVLSRCDFVRITDNDGRHPQPQQRQQTGSGCIASGFTRCCAFGACRVNLPEGGHCYCDQECFTYPHHNCCSDNPCDVISWERRYYYASESDSVEVCLRSGQIPQGIAHVRSIHPTNSTLSGQHLDERLRITPGGRNCWTITLQDDMIYNLQIRDIYEYLSLRITFYPTSGSTRSYSSTLIIVDDERVPAGTSLLTTESEPRFCTRGYYYYKYVWEGDQGNLCMHLLGQEGTLRVYLALQDGTARAFLDYNNTNQSVLFRAGENCVDINTLEDTRVEETEWFNAYLAIATTTGAKLLHTCHHIRIFDNEAPTLEQTSFTVDEGDGSTRVCMHFGGEARTTTVTFTIEDGSALSGSDYIGTTQTFVVNSGERRCITIEILDDSDVESQEYLSVELIAQSFSVRSSLSIYITDNDVLTLSLTASAYSVAESGGPVNVCVLGLRGTRSSSATATISTQDISATSGSDYTSISQSRTLRSGSTECVNIPIIDDTTQELTEVFLVTLSTSDAVRLENNTARVEIMDDDYVDCNPPCANGTCSTRGQCVCNAGWTGGICTIDINECLIDNGGCDQNCTNLPGSYSCSCIGGFILDEGQQMCNDNNECQAGSHNCTAPAQCVNFEGGFRCSCSTGYMLSDITYADCKDIDECALANGGCAHTCNNTDGSFSCMCDEGFELDDDGQQCIDLNECETGSHNCSTDDPAPAKCVNVVGGFRCSCSDYLGYRLDKSTYASCEDIDECNEGISGCSQSCVNTIGSFNCSCRSGYLNSELDHRICIDVDECEGNNDCEDGCINRLGTYQCTCSRGYMLHTDGRSCEPLRCPALEAPQNGTISCNRQTTGGQCSFMCDKGYTLLGTRVRVCFPSMRWSGRTAICRPRQCASLEPPDHGFVQLPCTNEYATSCSIQCEYGYNKEGPGEQFCHFPNGTDQLQWTEAPVCQESNICQPDTCKHNGTCSPTGPTTFTCDCEGTGFTGPTCNTGILSTPMIPTLTVNELSEALVLSAPAEEGLMVRADGGYYLQVSPRQFQFNPANKIATFVVRGIAPGFFMIHYALSGRDANDILPPVGSPVFVAEPIGDGDDTNYFEELGIATGFLQESCCMPHDISFQCPMSPLSNRITFKSACEWIFKSENVVSTGGVVFVVNNDFSLPLSVAGIDVDRYVRHVKLSQDPVDDCKTCTENENNPECYRYSFTTRDTQLFLQNRSLAYTYIENIRPLLFPTWLDIHIDQEHLGPVSNVFAPYDYTTQLVKPESISMLAGCQKLKVDQSSQTLYSVLRYGRTISAVIDGENLTYIDPRSTFSPGASDPICFAVDLCQGQSSPIHIDLSRPTQELLVSQFLREYSVNRGWDITIHSVTLSKAGMTTDPISSLYWNGNSFFQPDLPQYDLIVNTESRIPFRSGNLQVSVTFIGKFYYLYQDHHGVLVGRMDLEVNTTIARESRRLLLTGNSTTTSILDISGHTNCSQVESEDYKASGIATKLVHAQRPGQRFFSELLPFAEETTDCLVDVFVNLDPDLQLQGFSIHTGCPRLNLGRLTFTGMNHRLYFPGSRNFEQLCLQENMPEIADPSLLIYSTLKRDRLPLGNFLTLHQSDSSAALSLAFGRDDSTFVAKLDKVAVSFLDTNFFTSVDIANTNLQFTATATIFGRYAAYLIVSAPANDSSWDLLSFSISGVMRNETGGFYELLSESVDRQLRDRAITARRREFLANSARISSQQRLQMFQNQLTERRMELGNANTTYQDKLAEVGTASNVLLEAQKAFDNASEELQQYEEDVNNLCMEQFCEDICMSGRICTRSYIDSYTEETGRCPYTDFETRRVRIPPFFVDRRVWMWTLVCRKVSYLGDCNAECRLPPQDEVCFGKCVPVVVQVPAYHWGDIQVTVEKYQNCTVRVHNGTIPTTVCELNGCAVRRPDNSCVAENSACRVAQQVAFENLGQARQNIAEPFQILNEAQMNLSLARSAASIAQLRLESSQQNFNQFLPAYEGARLAHGLAEDSYQMTISEVEIGRKIFALIYEERIPSVDILRIVNVTFNITIAVESPSQFPILITYMTPRTGQVFEKMVDFDFSTRHQVELFNIITQEMVSESFQVRQTRSANSHSRSKRQEVESVSSNQRRFEENCADLQNTIRFFSGIATSLAQVNVSLNNAEQATEEQVQVISSQSQVGSLDEMNVVNFTVLESAFNVTANVEDLRERVKDDAEVKAYIALLEEEMKSISERLQTLKDNALPDWISRVEALYSQSTSVSGYSCFSFGDCLLIAVDILEALLQNTPGTEAEALLAWLPLAREELLELTSVGNLTVPEAIEKMNLILAIINDYTENNYWCSSPPLITLHPPPEVNISTDGTLNLTCEADSDLTVTYRWKKNGNTVPDSNSNQLILTNMQRLDSGNYTCHASNPVGTVSSISTSVLVYELPEFYLLPVPTSVYESDENGAWFACNATAWPYPGWRWYFRPTEDSAWIAIDGEITNELLIPLPQRRHEGWYTCEAYNAHGSIRAEGVYLRILRFTVSQQAIPIQFQIMSSEEECQVDGLCGNETVRENILQTLLELTDHTTTDITGLEVVQISECAYTCSFTLVTENVTSGGIQLIEIANRAVPKRIGLQQSKVAIESAIQQGEITIQCAPLTLRASVFSLIVQNLMYICPAGQQLSSNFLLCVSCEPGTFSAYTKQTRIFNGEAITERFQVCRPCPIGSYEPRVGSSMCTPCPEFHTTLSTGTPSAAQCIVDPLLLECTTDGSHTHVTIDCQSNRPPVTTMCSFDGGLEHQCDLPITVNIRTFTPGNHTLRITITDTVAITAQDTIEYLLENDTRPPNFLPDVPQLHVHFIRDSPRVNGSTMEADFILTRPAYSVTCQISRYRELNCSSGSVSFTNLAPGRYVLRVAATNSKEDRVIERRRFEISSDPSFCTTHLINGGVTVRGNTATVEFAGTGPAEMFSCKLDTEPAFACTSPIEVTELTAGEHTLKIVPQDCGKNRRPQNVKFTV